MSKTGWKILSLILAFLLTSLVILFGAPISNHGLLAQNLQICVQSEHWAYESVKSMIERYGISSNDFACKDGLFRADQPEVRANVAQWLGTALKVNEESFRKVISERAEDIERLQSLYKEILEKDAIRGLW